jgi:thioredoxin 1
LALYARKYNRKVVIAMGLVRSLATEAEFDDFISQHPEAVVEFWAEWCGPCRNLTPILEAIASDRTAQAFAKINVDTVPAVAERFGVVSIPATMVFRGSGEPLGQITGAKARAAFERDIDGFLSAA